MSISFIESGERKGQIDRVNFSNSKVLSLIWENIPNFAVITGKNGVGKTQLLYQFRDRANDPERKRLIVFRNDSYSQSIGGDIMGFDQFPNDYDSFIQSCKNYAITKDVLDNLKDFSIGQDLIKKIDSGELCDPNDETFDINVAKIIVSYPLDCDMRDIISDPVSIINKVFQLFDEKIKKIHSYITDPKRLEVFCNFYFKKENITNVTVDSYKKFHKEVANSKFKEELSEKYVEMELKFEHPCVEINKLLQKYNFSYRLKWKANKYGRKEIHFVRVTSEKLIPFSGLSSGEKVILDLLAWLSYFKAGENKQLNITRTSLMILDEPDSHLDPTYCETFFKIVYEEFVKAFNIQVLMATHRMDTVNLAPDESVFIMENDREIRCDKKEAFNRMNSSLRLTTSREANSALSDGKYVIQRNINYVLVENEGDAMFYSIVYHKLNEINKLTKYSAKTIFTPVGIKVIPSNELSELDKCFSKLSLDHNLPDVQKCKTLINNLKSKNDVGGGCDFVKKKVVIEVFKFYNIDEKLGTVKMPIEKENIEEPPVINYGLIDKDKGNKPKNSLHVIDVYSIENYLCMPLNLFYLFCEGSDSQSEIFRTKKERLEQLLKNDEVSTQVIENTQVESMSQESTSQELKSLNDMVIDCASKAIEALIEKLKEKKQIAANEVKTSLEKIEQSLQGADTKNIKLVNDIEIKCPTIIFEGLDYPIFENKKRKGKGHNLIGAINYIIYGTNTFGKKNEDNFFNALCLLPANLLPASILVSMDNLATSKLFKESSGKKRKQNEELQPTRKKSSNNL